MSQQFVNFITSLLNFETLEISEIFDLISKSNLTPSQICTESIDLFVIINFTGPPNAAIESSLITPEELSKFISNELTCEGEIPFKKCKALILLWLAKSISFQLRQTAQNNKSAYASCLSFMQCVYLHQAVLRDERSSQLKSEMISCYDEAVAIQQNDSAQPIEALDEFQLQILSCHLHLTFYEYRRAEELFERCRTLLGVSTQLRGALGKRTKFQQDCVSQLYLSVSRESVASAVAINSALQPSGSECLPNDHLRDDEVLLDEPQFAEGDGTVPQQPPTIAEQSLLVLQSAVHRLSRAKDEATMEECAAILCAATARVSTWAVASEALLQRCRLTTRSSRRTERALMQLEELANQHGKVAPSAGAVPASRSSWFFLSRLPAVWELQLQLARVLMAMGMQRSALDALLPWDQWGAIIDCFMALGQRERAERAIRERIATDGETAELLCCLGDVTKDRALYRRAWELSRHRSARAMRSLALHLMFVDRDHAQAAECFEASLGVNTLQPQAWFTYGCCCIAMRDYRKAVGAFKQCLRLEPDNFEAWNNCASALVELDERKNALALLREATKYSFENWRLWDNICIVASAAGEYGTAVKAYHRVMDLRQQHRDPAALSTMVTAVCTNAPAAADTPKLRALLKELFARIASQDGRDPRIWAVHAQLLADDEDRSAEMRVKVLQCLSRAHHGMCPSGWQQDTAQCRRAILSALQLVEKAVEYDISYTSAKLAVKSVQAVLESRRSAQVEPLDEEVLQMLTKIDEAAVMMADKE